ncbi:hypothetical protein [Bacillus sp. Marseille-Q3570]|uniref:hypothetical protein n=1 Tax=Bacillus sp. Marseille-Q3570 TaxID=2963522 RepID=UPI0021B6EF57|nr:hypothetical protein [Bacillus sp. Marseille-Q3570]
MNISSPLSLSAIILIGIDCILILFAVFSYALSREMILLVSLIALLLALFGKTRGENGYIAMIGLWGTASFCILVLLYAFIPFLLI